MIQTRGNVASKLKPGDRALLTRTFTETDSQLFVGLSGDMNPHHTDAAFCALTKFARPIVPGFLVASMATHIGGQWAVLAARFHMDFTAPVFAGDTITCEAVVAEVSDRYKVRVDFECVNRQGTVVVKGYFTGYPPDGERLEHLSRGVARGNGS
jgi:acyl dehydratase